VKGKRKRALTRESHDEDEVTAVIMTDPGYQANCRWHNSIRGDKEA
jgi:hypothetical protein